MTTTIHSKRHQRLCELLKAERERAGMTQADVARLLDRHQPFIAGIEAGQRRVDVVEFLQLAHVIGFDPLVLLADVMKKPADPLPSLLVSDKSE